jgi:drug/metabolite transporter (DMT)-like permease
VDKREKTTSPLDFALLLLLGVLWGIPYALTKISLETIPPITLTAARVSLAAIALWGVAAVSGRKLPWRLDCAARLFVQGGVTCVLPYTLIALGQQSVGSALAAILNSTTALFVYLISATWTHHEPMTFGRLSGALVGLVGVVLIAGASALLGLGRESAGQAAIVIATFSTAVGVVHGRRFADLPAESVAAGMLTCAAVVLVPSCLVIEAPWHTMPSFRSVVALLANAVGTTAFGFVLYFRLIRTIGSMGTASTGYLKPAVSVLIGCTLLGEPFTWTLAMGLVAVLFGVAAINDKIPVAHLLDVFKRGKDCARWNSLAHSEPISGRGENRAELSRP